MLTVPLLLSLADPVMAGQFDVSVGAGHLPSHNPLVRVRTWSASAGVGARLWHRLGVGISGWYDPDLGLMNLKGLAYELISDPYIAADSSRAQIGFDPWTAAGMARCTLEVMNGQATFWDGVGPLTIDLTVDPLVLGVGSKSWYLPAYDGSATSGWSYVLMNIETVPFVGVGGRLRIGTPRIGLVVDDTALAYSDERLDPATRSGSGAQRALRVENQLGVGVDVRVGRITP